MLANNRFFGTSAATRVSGLAPSPNGLPLFQILARQSSGYGKTVAAPRGYGAAGLAWAARAGELGSDVDATITLGATGSLVLGRFIDGSASIALDATGTVSAVASVAGSASIALDATGTMQGLASAAGSASVALDATATLTATAAIAGSASIALDATGTLGATADIAGVAYLSAAAEGSQLTADSIAGAVWAASEAVQLATQADELHRIHGLNAAAPLEVTDTTREAGAITQNIVEAPAGTVTVTRT